MKKLLTISVIALFVCIQTFAGSDCGSCDAHVQEKIHQETTCDASHEGCTEDHSAKNTNIEERYQTIAKGDAVDYTPHLKKGFINVVDFYAEWCGPCQRLMPFLQQMVTEHEDLRVIKLDIVNWDSELSKKYQIRSVPHVLLFDKELKQIGNNTQESIMKLMEIYNIEK